MKDITNIQKGLFEIIRVIANDEYIQRLLVDDTPDLSDASFKMATFNSLMKDRYINVYPYTETGIKDYTRNTFLILLLTSVDFNSMDNTIAYGSIFLATDINHCLLTGNRLRLLELANRINVLIDSLKTSAAGEVRVNTLSRMAFDPFHDGYRIDFRFSDQIAEEEKFNI